MAIGDAYVVSIYWAVTTMSTIGYGDIKPTNTAERLFAMFVMFVGAGIFTYGITNVVTAVATSNKAALEFRERLDALNVYMEAMQIPTHLRRRLRTYFQHLEQTSLIFRESHLLADVSPELQTQLARLANSTLIKKAPFFRDASDRCIADILSCLRQLLYMPAEHVIHEGDSGFEMFFLKQGTVQVYIQAAGVVLAVMTDAGYFGEVALLKGCRRGASVKCVSYAIMYSLHATDLRMLTDRYEGLRDELHRVADERLELMKEHEGAEKLLERKPTGQSAPLRMSARMSTRGGEMNGMAAAAARRCSCG